MRIGNYYVGVDCNGDLYEWEDVKHDDRNAVDRDFNAWLADMEECDEMYDDCWTEELALVF